MQLGALVGLHRERLVDATCHLVCVVWVDAQAARAERLRGAAAKVSTGGGVRWLDWRARMARRA
eukprot:4478484-Prymnesium_polylepis.1